MTIKKLNYITIEPWKDSITELIKASAKLNFPNMINNENYGFQKYEEMIEYLKTDKAIVFGAIEKDHLAGWVWCHEIKRMDIKRIHIAEIAVKREYRKQGVGKSLLIAAEEYAANNGFKELDLLVTESNEEALAFYKTQEFIVERYQMVKELL